MCNEKASSIWDAVPAAGQYYEWKLERGQGEWKRPVFMLATHDPKILALLSKCGVLGMPSVWPGKSQPRIEITIILTSHGTKISQKHAGKGALLES